MLDIFSLFEEVSLDYWDTWLNVSPDRMRKISLEVPPISNKRDSLVTHEISPKDLSANTEATGSDWTTLIVEIQKNKFLSLNCEIREMTQIFPNGTSHLNTQSLNLLIRNK